MIQQVEHFTPNLPKQPFRHNKQQKIDLQINNPLTQQHQFIINADDFGISYPRSKGILELIKARKVTSISVLVTGVNGDSVVQWSQLLKEYIFDTNTGLQFDKQQQNHQNEHLLKKVSIGLHFNLTEGPALCNSIPNTLINQKTKHFQGKTYIYQYLATGNRKTEPFTLSMQQFIKTELRMQIHKFIQLFSFRPSHIDGHNHVHVIPQVAELIAPIMREVGIYRTRLPLEELQTKNEKNEIFASNARCAKPIFDRYQLIYPTTFLGCEEINRLDFKNIEKKIMRKINEQYEGDNRFVELMCHPGYTDEVGGDEFNRNKGRQIEMNSLKSTEFTQIIESHKSFTLSNFNYLSPPVFTSSKPRILLYSKMSKGCGNWTTSLRLEQIFQSLGYEVYLRSIEENVNTEFEIESLRQFLIQFRVSLVIGVNLTRSGRVIYHATRSDNQLTNRVPCIFIVAGTDANIYFNNPEAATVLKEPLQNCQMLISLSGSMLKLTQQFLIQKLNFIPDRLPLRLVSQSSNILAFEKPSKQQIQKIHNCLKQNYNISIGKDKYIVFPASFRPVKDIEFLLKDFNLLMQKEESLRVLIMGPVLDKSYYEKCLSKLGRVEYLGSLEKELYVEVLKHAFILVNSSISEGQCCSIQEAHEVGQVSVVRANEGNSELVIHQKTGFLFNTPQQFLQIYQTLNRNQNNIRQRIRQSALHYHKENFSVEAEAKQYRQILSKLIPPTDSLFTYPDVHSISEINLGLYQQVPQQVLIDWFNGNTPPLKRVVDMGCGSGIFGLTMLQKFPQQLQKHIRLQMYDYNASVISNCYYNCLQQLSSKLQHINSVRLQVSDMFDVVQNEGDGHLVLANMPQTPFRKQCSRPDKNGGMDAMKYNQQIIRKFSTFNSNSVLIMLYSYMCQPKKFFTMLTELKLNIIWTSERTVFRISAKAYDQMEVNLSQFLKDHINQGRAQVDIVSENGEEIFIVPAQILVIQRQ